MGGADGSGKTIANISNNVTFLSEMMPFLVLIMELL